MRDLKPNSKKGKTALKDDTIKANVYTTSARIRPLMTRNQGHNPGILSFFSPRNQIPSSLIENLPSDNHGASGVNTPSTTIHSQSVNHTQMESISASPGMNSVQVTLSGESAILDIINI